MIFIDNKYSHFYYSIVSKAQSRIENTGYTEKHHIIPKSLNGSNASNNLVRLTPREHFICHWLLTKMLPIPTVYPMNRAFWLMCRMKNGANNQRYKVTSRIYEIAKLLNSQTPVTKETKEKLSVLGKQRTHSAETKIKIGIASKGRTWSAESRARQSVAQKNKPAMSIEQRNAISKANRRRIVSKETKDKISIYSKDRRKQEAQTKKQCPHCLRFFDKQAYGHYHGDQCKLKVKLYRYQMRSIVLDLA